MGSAWKERPLPASAGFTEFLDLFNAWNLNKTADPARLQAKIGRIWGNLGEQKKVYTSQLVATQSLDPLIVEVLSTFDGHIDSFDSYKWKRTLT